MSSLPPATAETDPGTADARVIWQIAGQDAVSFLQGLVTNDILPLGQEPGIRWAALLNPQGKYLADFFLFRRPGEAELHLDIDARLAPAVLRLLQLYKLRADVQISSSELRLSRGTGPLPAAAFADPRHPAMGWRLYDSTGLESAEPVDFAALRVEHLIPEYPHELRVNESYILEQGFERLSGVDFRKGCYVGQEVTARMKHKTELRKGLVRLQLEGEAEPGAPVTLEDGREAGILGTVSHGRALAHMRFDRLAQPLFSGDARLTGETPPIQS